MKSKHLNLRRPGDARAYIKEFRKMVPDSNNNFIVTNTGRTIYFDSMSDDDACVAAHLLLDIEQEIALKAVKH